MPRILNTSIQLVALSGLLAGGATIGIAAELDVAPAISQADDATADSVIKGSVQKNGRNLKQAQIRVELVGLGEKFRQKVKDDGTFEFQKVPAGTYVIKAAGSFKNAAVSGEVKDAKPGKAIDAEPIAVTVE